MLKVASATVLRDTTGLSAVVDLRRPLRLLRIAALIASGCGSQAVPAGSASIVVDVPSTPSAAAVTGTIHLRASDGHTRDQTERLVPSGGSFSGIFSEVPDGTCTFSAQALDKSGAVMAEVVGETPWTISPGHAPSVTLVLRSGTDDDPAPSIIESGADAAVHAPAIVSARASHPDGAAAGLTYDWTDSGAGGVFTDEHAPTTAWSPPPGFSGNAHLKIEVSDWLHKADSLDLVLSHGARKSGSVDVVLTFSHSPRIAGMTAANGQLAPGATTSVGVTASNPDGGRLHYSWYARCGGHLLDPIVDRDDPGAGAAENAHGGPNGWFDDRHAGSTRFTAPPGEGVCGLTVKIRRPGGPPTTGVLYIIVADPASIVHLAPQIDLAEMTPTTAFQGARITFRMLAHDPARLPIRYTFCRWDAVKGACIENIPPQAPVRDALGATVGATAEWIAPPCLAAEAGRSKTWNIAGAVKNVFTTTVYVFAAVEQCGR